MVDASSHSSSKPVELTVYDLPSPVDTVIDDASRTRMGRVRLFLILLICAAPVIASYVTYYWIRPQGTRVFGDLIEPQRPLPALTATNLKGQPVDVTQLRGQWLFIAVSRGPCELDCENLLYVQRQLHKALGKEADKLDRVYLISNQAAVKNQLVEALQGATVLHVDDAQLTQWLTPAQGRQLGDHLYLVDPMGNWMMRFPPHPDAAAAAKIKRDLERLMRAAASWDQPGR